MTKLAYHTCGRQLLVQKAKGKLTFKEPSFMSSPLVCCPSCQLTILLEDICYPKVELLARAKKGNHGIVDEQFECRIRGAD